MNSPDEYGERRRPPANPQNIEQFPAAARRPEPTRRPEPDMARLAADIWQPNGETAAEASLLPKDPDERAKLMLDQIAEDMLWLPYGSMMTFAKEVLGNDGAAPKTANEMADVIHRWAKERAGKR